MDVPGPPPVMIKARSKVLKASMVLKMTAMSRSGVTNGRVIYLNVNHLEALSIAAAS